jgi:uncharacterized protein (TIGR02145 family)/uncharacterized repeat protein (TIGR02543 family)
MLPQNSVPAYSHFLKYLMIFCFGISFPFFVLCVNAPENPYQSKNITIAILLESSDKKADEFSLVDSTGKTFRIGIRPNILGFIDSIRISITSQTTALLEIDTFLKPVKYFDTAWCGFILNTEGARNVIVRAYLQDNRIYSDSATISIFNRNVIVQINHAPQWAADTISLSGSVSSTLHITLNDKCSDPDSDSVVFILPDGLPIDDSIINGSYSFCPSQNDTGIFHPQIFARDTHGNMDTVNLKIAIRVLDTIKPKLTLVSPGEDGARISSNACQIKVKCTDASGISFVKCKMDADSFAVLRSDSIYVATIIGLKTGSVNNITFVVTDASSEANRDSLIVHIIYDSTLQDDEPPLFSYGGGPKDHERIVIPKDTIIYTITDRSGIDSVFWTLNGIFAGTIKKQASDNYKAEFTLTKFGNNRVTIHARDSSANKNCDSVVITLNYNTKPGPVSPVTPSHNAVGVDTLPVFSWTGGDDADGDTVYYGLFYGTSPNDLPLKAGDIIGKTVSVPIPEKMKVFTKYYWKVIAYSKVFPDTISGRIDSFTTTKTVLSIIHSPSSITFNEGDTLTLSVAVTGTPPPNNYQWYRNDTVIANATRATYKKIDVKVIDAGEYYVVVSNDAGDKATSAKAIVSILCKVSIIYNGNGYSGGTVPDTTTHLTGTQITIAPQGTLYKIGYTFLGWNTDSTGRGLDYAAGATLKVGTKNVTLYARWSINQYSVIFDPQGGSAVLAQTIKHGNTVSIPVAPTKRSYTFGGWFKETGCTNAWNFINDKITAPDTLYAKWVIMDADSNIYTQVTIGTQVWMVENLKTTKYNDGTLVENYTWYDNEISNKEKYGALYGWSVADPANSKKVAPTGWHLPSVTEWTTLQNYLIANGFNYDGSNSGNKIGKAMASTTDWTNCDSVGKVGNNQATNNRSGFSAMPGGYFYNFTHQSFGGLGQEAYWWCTSDKPVEAILEYNSEVLTIEGTIPYNVCSIRLIKD